MRTQPRPDELELAERITAQTGREIILDLSTNARNRPVYRAYFDGVDEDAVSDYGMCTDGAGYWDALVGLAGRVGMDVE